MIKSIRGTRDLLPPETALWNFVEAAARDVFRAYNFHEIRTPIFEDTQLFRRSVGEETDIVSKEMYTWEDGARAADYAVYKKWMTTRYRAKAFEDIDPEAAGPDQDRNPALDKLDPNPARFMKLDGKPTFIIFRYRPTFQDFLLLKLADEQPDKQSGSRLQLRVVTAHSVPESLKVLLEEKEVTIETVSIESDPQSLTLRPENTAGVVRAYIEHKLWERPGVQKLFYIGPQFRRERPQKGRYRQFYQIGAEVIGPPASGSESPVRDAELLELLATLLDRLGIQGWTLELNSVGCANDRALYNEALRQALTPIAPTMCADCQRRAVTNPLRVFDCKVPEDQPKIEKLPRISQFLDEPCREHFVQVQTLLSATKVPFVINDRLVRGLDYYTRTAFEFVHGGLGAQNAILGGGRYDGLSESLGGPQAPGIGFAIGEDRLVLTLAETQAAVTRPPDAYIAPLGEGMNVEAAKLAHELRRHDLAIELGDERFRMKKSLETASKIGARYALIVGENEVKANAFVLKNLATGEQVTVPRADLAKKLQGSE